MNYEELVGNILERVGTRENVTSATNCMTRLRIKVKDDQKIDAEALKQVKGVLGIVQDRKNYIEVVVGPGKSSKCGEVCRKMGIPTADVDQADEAGGQGNADAKGSVSGDWRGNKEAVKAMQKENPVRSALKVFGEIFVPLIPGVIADSGSDRVRAVCRRQHSYSAAESGLGGQPLSECCVLDAGADQHFLFDIPDCVDGIPSRGAVWRDADPGRNAGHDHRARRHQCDRADDRLVE